MSAIASIVFGATLVGTPYMVGSASLKGFTATAFTEHGSFVQGLCHKG